MSACCATHHPPEVPNRGKTPASQAPTALGPGPPSVTARHPPVPAALIGDHGPEPHLTDRPPS